MKFKELESKVKLLNYESKWNFSIENRRDAVTIFISKSGQGLYRIPNTLVGSVHEFGSALELPERDRLALQKLAYKYSRTPIDERRDEPKFRVRMMPNLPNQNSSLYYVNYSLKNSEIDVGPDVDMSEDPLFRSKCHFTKKEYVSIQREFPEWLPKFDKDDPHFEIVEEDK